MKEFMLAYVVSAVASLFMVTSPATGETWTHFTGDNVTIPEHPIDMAIDHDGMLWVGNWYGLWSYDGVEWTTWFLRQGNEWPVPFPGEEQLPGSFVNTITVDNDNSKWFTMYGGVVRYDGSTWDFIPLDEETLLGTAMDHDGVIWFGTFNNGVWSYEDTEWIHYPAVDIGAEDHDMMAGATVDSDNVKWFTYSKETSNTDREYGILRYDNVTWSTYIFGEIDEWRQPAIAVTADDDVIWVGTGEGVYRFEGEGITGHFGDEYLGHGAEVYEIAIGPDNVKWFGTGENGVTSFNGNTWTTYDKTNGLPDNLVLTIAIDDNNIKWFGTDTGVSRLDGTPLSAEESPIPAPFSITGNYPNPFNPDTTIEFSFDAELFAALDIYDISGQHIKTLSSASFPTGKHTVTWDGTDDAGTAVSSGVYFCRLRADGRTAVHRMALVR